MRLVISHFMFSSAMNIYFLKNIISAAAYLPVSCTMCTAHLDISANSNTNFM